MPAAVRELLALQSSDWAFLVTRDISGPYPRERAAAHLAALDAALAAPGDQNPHYGISPPSPELFDAARSVEIVRARVTFAVILSAR